MDVYCRALVRSVSQCSLQAVWRLVRVVIVPVYLESVYIHGHCAYNKKKKIYLHGRGANSYPYGVVYMHVLPTVWGPLGKVVFQVGGGKYRTFMTLRKKNKVINLVFSSEKNKSFYNPPHTPYLT